MERTIIIDNLAENFSLTTPSNGLWIRSWFDDMDDTMLLRLIPFLKDISLSRVNVQSVLEENLKVDLIYPALDEGRDLPSVDDLLSLD